MGHRIFRRDSLFSLIIGPLVWTVHFLTVYIGSAVVCAKGWRSIEYHGYGLLSWIIGIATLIAVVLILIGAVISVRRWRGAGVSGRYRHQSSIPPMPPHDQPNVDSRRRFMAYAGLLLAGLSLIAVSWQALPVVFIDSCR